jgi:hypothetical protein
MPRWLARQSSRLRRLSVGSLAAVMARCIDRTGDGRNEVEFPVVGCFEFPLLTDSVEKLSNEYLSQRVAQ